jgi:hypothetical protein
VDDIGKEGLEGRLVRVSPQNDRVSSEQGESRPPESIVAFSRSPQMAVSAAKYSPWWVDLQEAKVIRLNSIYRRTISLNHL